MHSLPVYYEEAEALGMKLRPSLYRSAVLQPAHGQEAASSTFARTAETKRFAEQARILCSEFESSIVGSAVVKRMDVHLPIRQCRRYLSWKCRSERNSKVPGVQIPMRQLLVS